MRIHLAGLCTGQTYKWFMQEKLFPKFILDSFFYLEKWLFDLPTFDVNNFMLDSGAFTFMSQKKEVKNDWDAYVERYAQTIVERGIKYFFELDIDNVVGLAEVERLREKLERLTGRKCIPVFHKARGQQYWLDMIGAYDYVAIGGIVSREIRQTEFKFLRWFLDTAREKKVKVHGLGFTNSEQLLKYPFYSVDSTSWIGGRYGLLYRFLGSKMQSIRRPPNTRMKSYRQGNKFNLQEWIKYQNYAENHL